jgi:hypothetical protein
MKCFYNATFPAQVSHGTEQTAIFFPCFSVYHLSCIHAGFPFKPRVGDDQAMSAPQWKSIPIFVCEACVVRVQIQQELTTCPKHVALLMLERMRLIDLVHHWSRHTLVQYDSKLKIHQNFLQAFGLAAPPIHLPVPPRSHAIVLMWSILHYSLRPGKSGDIKFSTIRQLRSARSAQETWINLMTDIDSTFPALNHLPISNLRGRSTDTYAFTIFAKGLENRLGDEATPSVALTDTQIHFINSQLQLSFEHLHGEDRLQTALAAFANVVAWTGWLRASELFGLRWSDITVIRPEHGIFHALPPPPEQELCCYNYQLEQKLARIALLMLLLLQQLAVASPRYCGMIEFWLAYRVTLVSPTTIFF